MKKILPISLIIVAVVVIWAVFALRGQPENVGYIKKVTASGVRAHVYLQSITRFGKTVRLYAAKVEKEVPAGTYKVKNIVLEAEQDGNKWWVQSPRPSPELERIEVKTGQSTELTFGPPFVVKTDVSTKGEAVSVGLAIYGRANERYHPAVKKNNQRQPAPKLRVVDQAGKALAVGTFEYGWGGTCRYSWRVPKDFKGKYQVKVDMDLGPFETKMEETWHLIE